MSKIYNKKKNPGMPRTNIIHVKDIVEGRRMCEVVSLHSAADVKNNKRAPNHVVNN